jgi:hypothetical protein
MKNFQRLAVASTALLGLAAVTSAQEVTGVHPAYEYADLMPSGFDPAGLGGLDFLGNDGVIATWGGSQKNAGEVWILPGLATGTVGTPVKVDGPLREALGLRVVDGALYVLTKPELLKYVKQGNTWSKSSLSKGWAYNDGQWHHFAFSLVHHQGSFYFTTGTAYEPDNNEDPQRGSLIKVNPTSGAFEALVKGLRNANGLVVGPDGELFATDNQGHWVPTNKLVHLKPGRFYGFRTSKNATSTTQESPPAIWLPYGTFSNSPTRPLLLTDGPYKGHMLAGDVMHGGLQRYFLEKVGGEYQGVAFRFSQGIRYGVNELVPGPDGSIYTAGIGGGGGTGMGGSGNWNYNSRKNGLGRLKLTGTVPFEMLAVRSRSNGFEIEFTHPANAAAATAANYVVKSWWYQPTYQYGGNPVGTADARVTSVTLNAEKTKATLVIENFQPMKVYHIRLSNIAKEGGGALWTPEAWYTVLKAAPADPTVSLRPQGVASGPRVAVFPASSGAALLRIPFHAPYDLVLTGLDGRRAATLRGETAREWRLEGLRPGLYILSGRVDGNIHRQTLRIP